MADESKAQRFVRQLAADLQLPVVEVSKTRTAIMVRANADPSLIEVSAPVIDDTTVELHIGPDLTFGPSLRSAMNVNDEYTYEFAKEIITSALHGSITEHTTRRNGEVVKYELKSPLTTMNEQPGIDGSGQTETRAFSAYPSAEAGTR